MGSQSTDFPSSFEGFVFDNQIGLPDLDQTLDIGTGFILGDDSSNLSCSDVPSVPMDPNPQVSVNTWSVISEGDSSSPSDDSESSDSVLKYISQVLMEEDMEEKPCMFHDALALQAAEKSLYEVIGEKYPPSPNQYHLCKDQNVDSDYGGNSSATSSITTLSDSSGWLEAQMPSNFVFRSTSKSSVQSPFNFSNGIKGRVDNGIFGSNRDKDLISSMFSESELVMQFNKGVEEASKFLPKGNQLVIDVEEYTLAGGLKEKNQTVAVKTEGVEKEQNLESRWIGKKSHEREDENLEEERSNKQSAVCDDESELSEMFDRILLCGGGKEKPMCILDQPCKPTHQNSKSTATQLNGQEKGTKSCARKPGNGNNHKEIVDWRTLLILCAQAVSGDDRRTANELLKQIRQHSSPFGDGSQRLAHYFANSLEARLAGTGTQIYTTLSSKKTSAADMLKAFQKYVSVCPFKKIAIIFANHSIMDLAQKANTLHIIDFGISYGFQWPPLIQRLAWRHGGPPKLRITGIELPQSGFRPAEGVLETGQRLARCCERLKVPFEYNGIAQKWETIKVEDLKINPDEFVAVNCLFRFKNLLDETVVVNSPRNAVLNLIRKINPNIFIEAILSGSYNAPFFVTRFKEALFHYSTLFDMSDTNLPREDQMRLMFEKEFFGREIMNVVACEGTQRVERPETYKQWQVRTTRAGFRQLPLAPELMKRLKCKVEAHYHNDFVVDEDAGWVLQGWKGRTIYASSAWVPS